MKPEWIGRQGIECIEGALRPSAYVARAYKHARENNGISPDWAKKSENGNWLFDIRYIRAQAEDGRESISVKEAADILEVTRRTIQTWVDEGEVSVIAGRSRKQGEPRRIAKDQFLRNLPRLRERLKTPAVVGYKRKHGKHVPQHLVQRIEAERNINRAAAGERRLIRRREEKKALREISVMTAARAGVEKEKKEKLAAIEAQLMKAREARLMKVKWEEQAVIIAEEIVNDMLDDAVSPAVAVTTFNRLTDRRGIPGDIRLKVSKKYFEA